MESVFHDRKRPRLQLICIFAYNGTENIKYIFKNITYLYKPNQLWQIVKKNSFPISLP